MLFIDTLMSVIWGSSSQADEASFHTPNEPAPAPLRTLPRPSLVLPAAAVAVAAKSAKPAGGSGIPLVLSSSPSAGKEHAKFAVEQQQQQQQEPRPKKHKTKLTEEVAIVDPETFTASLVIHPFTLKNMSFKYVHDLKWDLTFRGVNWRFFLHVISSERRQCDTALVGLQVSGECPGSSAHSCEDVMAPLSALPRSESCSSSASSSSTSSTSSTASRVPGSPVGGIPAVTTFQVSWKVVSNDTEVPVAVCPPSAHHIEAGDDYVVEFTNDEFNFASALEHGLTLQVLIKLLPDPASTSQNVSDNEEEEEDEEIFYDSEEDERAHQQRRLLLAENTRNNASLISTQAS